MPPLDRRDFVVSAAGLAASLLVDADGAVAEQQAAEAPPTDPAALLNREFRTLYGVNREELLNATPLAALTLIGTGEIWRVEFGQAVKSYPPPPWIVRVKGLMHGVIAAQATGARLIRGVDPEAARNAAATLSAGLTDAAKQTATDLPPAVTASARAVLEGLRALASEWAAGRQPEADEFSETAARLRPDLGRVLTATGEAVYDSVIRGLQACAHESDTEAWNSCLVGVCGAGFARRDNIEIAAAMSVLGRDSVGTRLLYLENAFTIPAGIAQIAGALADRELGNAVFGDPYRMWRDLLGDVAARHVGGGFFPETGRAG
jgi:hypothetical protein